MAEIAYLCHKMHLASYSVYIIIGSGFNNDSNFKCILMSLIGLVASSVTNNSKVCLVFSSQLLVFANQFAIAVPSYTILFYANCNCKFYQPILKYALIMSFINTCGSIASFLMNFLAIILVAITLLSAKHNFVKIVLALVGYKVNVALVD